MRGAAASLSSRHERSVDEYLGHLSVERGASQHTLSAYGRDLDEYRVFLAGRGVSEVGSVSA